MSQGHSLVVEVTNPYDVKTDGCPSDMSPCLSNGGLRAFVDGEEVDDLLQFSRDKYVTDGIAVSASNLPVECRQFGGDKIWARMYDEMLHGQRELGVEESFEDWILHFDHMAAPDWCAQYVAQNHLADVQSIYSVFKIVTPSVTVRLNVGTNFQGNGELDWDGRVLPDLEFWQMDVGVDGLSLESQSLTGILGETARPVLDKDGRKVMQGYDAIRGTVEDYHVSSALGTDFAVATEKRDSFVKKRDSSTEKQDSSTKHRCNRGSASAHPLHAALRGMFAVLYCLSFAVFSVYTTCQIRRGVVAAMTYIRVK